MDLLDRKILYELGKNARQSYGQIAGKINSKKPVVAYRIQRLEREVIWKYVPVVSLTRLGIYSYKIYFRFHGLSKETEKAMIDSLAVNPRICWVALSTGQWDLLIATYAKNVMEFAEVKNDFFRKYGKYVYNYSISVIEDALVFNRDYLLGTAVQYRKELVFGGRSPIERINSKQEEFLSLIRNNARYSLVETSKKLKLNARTALKKIKDLEARSIIQGYVPFVRPQKLGRQLFKLVIYLKNFTETKYNSLLTFAKQQSDVIHIIKCIGDWELEFELECESVDIVYEFMKNLRSIFPEIIEKIDLVIITVELKLDMFPSNI